MIRVLTPCSIPLRSRKPPASISASYLIALLGYICCFADTACSAIFANGRVCARRGSAGMTGLELRSPPQLRFGVARVVCGSGFTSVRSEARSYFT